MTIPCKVADKIPKARGLTLLEIIFIITITAIIAAVVIPRITGTQLYDRFNVYTAGHKIAAYMRLARRLAVTTGDDHRLNFSRAEGSDDYNRYQLQRYEAGDWQNVGSVNIIPDAVDVLDSDNDITFSFDGSCDGNYTLRYAIGSQRYRIQIRSQTGYIKFEDY